MTTLTTTHGYYEADEHSARGVAEILEFVQLGELTEAVELLSTKMGHTRHDAAAIVFVLGDYRRPHTLTVKQRAGLTPFMNAMERAVTFEMALNDRPLLCVDLQLVCEEAMMIDHTTLVEVLFAVAGGKDLLQFLQKRRVMRELLRKIQSEHPALWLNAISGVYRNRQGVVDSAVSV